MKITWKFNIAVFHENQLKIEYCRLSWKSVEHWILQTFMKISWKFNIAVFHENQLKIEYCRLSWKWVENWILQTIMKISWEIFNFFFFNRTQTSGTESEDINTFYFYRRHTFVLKSWEKKKKSRTNICVSSAIMVARKCHNVTSPVHCLSYLTYEVNCENAWHFFLPVFKLIEMAKILKCAFFWYRTPRLLSGVLGHRATGVLISP
jgi:hypothetical protein